MTLATVASDMRPSTRVVLLKGCSEAGLVWYTNRHSRKGQELAANPYAALQFHWVELERVVRIEGMVQPIDDAQSDAYYASRPLDSRIGAWASPQSEVVQSRAATATALGWLRFTAAPMGVLAGPSQSPARPFAVCATPRWRVAAAAPGTLVWRSAGSAYSPNAASTQPACATRVQGCCAVRCSSSGGTQCGASSRRGCSTNARSCQRGCGSVSTALCTLA